MTNRWTKRHHPNRTLTILAAAIVSATACSDDVAVTATAPTGTTSTDQTTSSAAPLDRCPSTGQIGSLLGETVESTPSALGGTGVVFDCRFRLDDSSSFGLSVERHQDPRAAFEQGLAASPGAQRLDGLGDDAYRWVADESAAFVSVLSGETGCTARWSSFEDVDRPFDTVLADLDQLVRLVCGL